MANGRGEESSESRDPLPLVDGGFVLKPEFAPYAQDGSAWIIEGHGVDPDIVVDNDPGKEFAGTDQQLDRAIDEGPRRTQDRLGTEIAAATPAALS